MKYRKGYKYQLAEDDYIQTSIIPSYHPIIDSHDLRPSATIYRMPLVFNNKRIVKRVTNAILYFNGACIILVY